MGEGGDGEEQATPTATPAKAGTLQFGLLVMRGSVENHYRVSG